jgi:hypothetical protein
VPIPIAGLFCVHAAKGSLPIASGSARAISASTSRVPIVTS